MEQGRYSMTKEERLKIYEDATELWGEVAQYDQLIEEMGELIVAINKLKRKLYHNEYKDRDVMQEVVEEMTDVKMSIEQIELTFLKDQNFDAMLNKKCTKLKNLIEKMKAEK